MPFEGVPEFQPEPDAENQHVKLVAARLLEVGDMLKVAGAPEPLKIDFIDTQNGIVFVLEDGQRVHVDSYDDMLEVPSEEH